MEIGTKLILLKSGQLISFLIQTFLSMLMAPFYKKDKNTITPTTTSYPKTKKGSYLLLDPYAHRGFYYKAQLHLHTNRSADGLWSREEAISTYKKLGYKILAIADHDRVNNRICEDPELLIIPAEEHTFPRPFWPLGPHAVILFPQKHVRGRSFGHRLHKMNSQRAMINIAHPSWPGSLGSGQWHLEELLTLSKGFQLMEVCSSKSEPAEDTLRWHNLISHLGPDKPVWATAGDDSHSMDFYHYCWLEIKASSFDLDSIRHALNSGSFYPTMGPQIAFSTEDNLIKVALEEEAHISFIAGVGPQEPPLIVSEVQGIKATYKPKGDEQFVRVEVVNSLGQRAWSQPFWLISNTEASHVS